MLRKIDNKPKWTNYRINPQEWLEPNDVPGDLLTDIGTKRNELSVFEVKNNKSNLDQIISAMAANRKDPIHIDYILIEMDSIVGENYALKKADGRTLIDEVNKNFHLNIEKLSGNRLVELAKILSTKEVVTVRTKNVLKKVRLSVDNGEIDPKKLSEEMREAVEKVII